MGMLVLVRPMRMAIMAVAVVTATAGCAAEATTTTAPSATTPTPDSSVTVVSVVDGDTIETSAGTVRIIGIDAPERGACGYGEAADFVSSLLRAGDPITLELPSGQNDADRYGRSLRYLTTAQGADVGASLLAAGLAVARYDSSDGYPAHPREAAYHSAQEATLTAEGSVITSDCRAQAAAEQAAAEQAAEQAAAEQARIAAEQARIAAEQEVAPNGDQQAAVEAWWLRFSSCAKLKKNTDGLPIGPFSRDDAAQAPIYEWFANGTGNHGDGDGDGLACE